MNRPILFLDIDGVLNDNVYHQPADSTTIEKPCMGRLNKIVAETNCQIVLSTGWRYMIHNKAMTPIGFFNMLRTHGLTRAAEIIGITQPDEVGLDGIHGVSFTNGNADRGEQIKLWIEKYGLDRLYCIVDDNDFGISKLYGNSFVHTDGNVGMTDDDMNKIIAILKGW